MKLVCIDRDGTLVKDDNYYLGKDDHWREQVSLLDSVITGIHLLNNEINTYASVITQQSGIAITHPDYSSLTEQRAHDVNAHIRALLANHSAYLESWLMCPYVDVQYASQVKKQELEVHRCYLHDNHRDIKPNIGLVEKAAAEAHATLEECDVYVIGDRLTDVQTGLNANGTGILVPSAKTDELRDLDKVKALKEQHGAEVHIALNFRAAVEYILNPANSGKNNF